MNTINFIPYSHQLHQNSHIRTLMEMKHIHLFLGLRYKVVTIGCYWAMKLNWLTELWSWVEAELVSWPNMVSYDVELTYWAMKLTWPETWCLIVTPLAGIRRYDDDLRLSYETDLTRSVPPGCAIGLCRLSVWLTWVAELCGWPDAELRLSWWVDLTCWVMIPSWVVWLSCVVGRWRWVELICFNCYLVNNSLW